MSELTTTPPDDLVRLHITPFNPAIYEKIIPAAFRKPSRKVSFHAIQTLPDLGFGYLELLSADAEALRKKLNGSILKGTKIRIEAARPLMKRKIDTTEEPVEKTTHKKRAKTGDASRTKGRDAVLLGHKLSADRHVKRGWAEDRSASRKPKSTTATEAPQAIEHKKVLFKTILPANVPKPTGDKNKKPKEKGKRKKKGEIVVEEFAKNRSTFAVSQASSIEQKPAVAYEDGVGWVDEDGQVVEAARRQLQQQYKQHPRAKQESEQLSLAEPTTSLEHTASQSEAVTIDPVSSGEQEASERENTSDEEGEEDATSNDESEPTASRSSSEDSSDAESTGEHEVTTYAPEIHPFEALYKRPAGKAEARDRLAPINTSFSFFDAQDDSIDDTVTILPQTPHMKQDLEWRHQRSAAPTPDTAAINGRFGLADSDGDSEEATPTQPLIDDERPHTISVSDGAQQESAFRKFFYEKRGETDRAWKKRRREAKKLERQRENRRLSRKVV